MMIVLLLFLQKQNLDLSFPSTLALEEYRSEGILGMVLQSWVPFVNYKLAQLFVFDKYKPHFVFHKLVPISSISPPFLSSLVSFQ